jgi:hypothetical protein
MEHLVQFSDLFGPAQNDHLAFRLKLQIGLGVDNIIAT